jgi:hypothetical protein
MIYEMKDDCQSILSLTTTTTEHALQLFDGLEPVDLEFMTGRWKGSEIHTDHPMNGFLEASNWYGKEFIDPETVHPLLFLDSGQRITKVAPNPVAMEWMLKTPVFKNESFKPLVAVTTSLLKTEQSQARLRMMEFRGKVSATMIYDYLPINDAFRRVDDNTVFGVMDYKTVPQPFFFTLKRVLQN